LNLQHAAAVVVNMDLPWNPAVLEQRIGRVHRMGQSRGVQVVNFVGQGSIEEGILSILAFKKSLFAGVLDGGENEVFMQGTRLSQFMKSVEQVAGAIGEVEVDAEPGVSTGAAQDMPVEPLSQAPVIDLAAMDFAAATPDAPAEAPTQAEPVAASPLPVDAAVATTGTDTTPATGTASPATGGNAAADPWAAILEAGAALLQGLAASRGAGASRSPIAIERDPVTGQASVRLPLPDPAVLQRLAKAFEPWLR
jgi:hypothetical protein